MISRFCFNISIYESLKNIFNIFMFKKKNFEPDLKKELSRFYGNQNFYFFDYGRTAFFEILCEIKKNTWKIFAIEIGIDISQIFFPNCSSVLNAIS